jgi:hypothetical protein
MPNLANKAKLIFLFLLCMEQVPAKLKIHPISSGSPQESCEPERGARGHPTPLVDELIHPLIGNMNTIREIPLSKAHRLKELFEKHLTWVGGLTLGWDSNHGFLS